MVAQQVVLTFEEEETTTVGELLARLQASTATRMYIGDELPQSLERLNRFPDSRKVDVGPTFTVVIGS